MLRIADLRPAGVNEGVMLKHADKRADKAAGLKHVVADKPAVPKHADPKHGDRRIAVRSAAGRWPVRREDSDRLAWALVAQAGVAPVGVVPVGDADHAALVRPRWLGKRVQVGALDDQTVLAAPVDVVRVIAAPLIAAPAIVRGPRQHQTESVSGSTS
jgi:hypothetical protein